VGAGARLVHFDYSRHESDDQLARLGREGAADYRLQHLPSAAERSAKDLDEVVALAGQRKYRALVDKTFPRRAGHRDHRSPRISAKAPGKVVLTF
jgi:hypothetical protein